MNEIAVLGLDVGLSSTGFAVATVDPSVQAITKVREIGSIQTSRTVNRIGGEARDDLRRGQVQVRALREVCDRHGVSAVALELSTLPPSPPTYLFGVMVGIVASLELPTVRVDPRWVHGLITRDKNLLAWAIDKTRKDDIIWRSSLQGIMLAMSPIGENLLIADESPAKALAAIEVALQLGGFQPESGV